MSKIPISSIGNLKLNLRRILRRFFKRFFFARGPQSSSVVSETHSRGGLIFPRPCEGAELRGSDAPRGPRPPVPRPAAPLRRDVRPSVRQYSQMRRGVVEFFPAQSLPALSTRLALQLADEIPQLFQLAVEIPLPLVFAPSSRRRRCPCTESDSDAAADAAGGKKERKTYPATHRGSYTTSLSTQS